MVSVEPEILDFASQDGKEKTKLKAEITNNSNQKLTMKIVDYPDGLANPVLRRNYLNPNSKTELLVKLNRRVKLDRMEKSITVELDDKDKTRFTIPLKKDVTKKKPPPKTYTAPKPVKKEGG